MTSAQPGAARRTRSAAAVAALALAALGATAAPSLADTSPIAIPAGNVLFLELHGVGQQVYQCDESSTGTYAWTLLTPAATLFAADGAVAGFHHYTYNSTLAAQEPTWISTDGSWVQGEKIVTEASPSGAADIPWLLLKAVATSAPANDGVFSTVTYVQRTDTVGGVAPSTTCAASNSGSVQGSDYSADYSYYRTAG
jgi:hypothetical protein